jgi:DNA-binding FadR family transcriptional regulator
MIADGSSIPGPPALGAATVRRLGVSINTVRTAYGRLQADGLVVMRQGARTKVAEKLRAARSSWAWTSSCDASCGIHEPVG